MNSKMYGFRAGPDTVAAIAVAQKATLKTNLSDLFRDALRQRLLEALADYTDPAPPWAEWEHVTGAKPEDFNLDELSDLLLRWHAATTGLPHEVNCKRYAFVPCNWPQSDGSVKQVIDAVAVINAVDLRKESKAQ